MRINLLAVLLVGLIPAATSAQARSVETEERVCQAAIPDAVWDAALAGNTRAKATVGQIILSQQCGRGPDAIQLGLSWLVDAVEEGHVGAAVALAIAYHDGDIVPQSRTKAVGYYRRAAEADQIDAQHTLGVLLVSSGQPDEQDEGLYWLGAAAGQGDGMSAAFTGMLYAQGLHGVPQDTCLALDWYEASALLEATIPVQAFIEKMQSAERAGC